MPACSISSRTRRCGGVSFIALLFCARSPYTVLRQSLAGSPVFFPVQLWVRRYGCTRLCLGREVGARKAAAACSRSGRRRCGWDIGSGSGTRLRARSRARGWIGSRTRSRRWRRGRLRLALVATDTVIPVRQLDLLGGRQPPDAALCFLGFLEAVLVLVVWIDHVDLSVALLEQRLIEHIPVLVDVGEEATSPCFGPQPNLVQSWLYSKEQDSSKSARCS
jgi:hypothetical protein